MEHPEKWIVVLLVVYGVTLHELGHAYMATWCGDPTPGRHGRLTFNPLVQLHPLYSVLFPIFTYATMGWPMGFAFCPIDPSRFKHPLRDRALTALAGPVMNFAITLFCVGVLWIPTLTPPGTYNRVIFFGWGVWNLLLGVFNLLPFPGLDGYDVIRPALPLVLRGPLDNFRRMGFFPLLLAMALGSRLFGHLFGPLIDQYCRMLPLETAMDQYLYWFGYHSYS